MSQKIDRFSQKGFDQVDVDVNLRAYMTRVYNYMAIALGVTGLTAAAVASSPSLMGLFFATPLKWVVLFAPLVLVLIGSARFDRMSFSGAQVFLWGYSALMGVSAASIFYVFTAESIGQVFLITAGTFGAMSLYGYTTNRDLTAMGSFMIMGLIGVILASLVNLFFQSSGLQFVLSVLSVIIFTGLTAYDVQNIKLNYWAHDDLDTAGKKAVYGALQLYLDFINLFFSLLRLFGDRR